MPLPINDNLTKSISIEAEAGLPHVSACSVLFSTLHCLDELLNISMDKPVCANMVLCSILKKQTELYSVICLQSVS